MSQTASGVPLSSTYSESLTKLGFQVNRLFYWMITESGNNLSVLITTETGQDWQTFATWYSIYKNLPNAKVAISCARNSETPFQYFQWTKRINVPVIRHSPFDTENPIASRLDAIGKAISQKIIEGPVLVVKELIMTIDVLDQKLLEQLNSSSQIFDNDVWFLKQPNMPEMMNSFLLDGDTIKVQEKRLCSEAKDSEEIRSIVSYRKGCGKWIDRLKGCPFSNANGLMTADMTSSENRIIELWKKMCTLYSVVV